LVSLFSITKAQGEFITTWKPATIQNASNQGTVPSTSTQIWFPVLGTNFTIYWEEVGYPAHNATLDNVTSTDNVLIEFGVPHNPNTASAMYTVKVSQGNGNFHRIRFKDNDPGNMFYGDSSKIFEINQWGNTVWSSMHGAFTSCQNLDMLATDVPDLTECTTMYSMFSGCEKLVGNSSMNSWDTSRITDMTATFGGCRVFNQNISNWDTGNVTIMAIMFLLAEKFNQPIGNWNTSNVQYMNAMFQNAKVFNQPIGNWDVGNVEEFELTFMMAKAFNQDIGNWNTSSAIEMNSMFTGASAFNQNISNWNTSNVTKMQNMFQSATSFNQNIGSWDTSNVMYMNSMFQNATAFNQNLGNWNLNSVTNALTMLLNSGLNCQNYDSTLYGWRMNPVTPNNINLGSVLPLVYATDAAATARDYLIGIKNWTILNDVNDRECSSFLATQENVQQTIIKIYPNPASDYLYVTDSGKILQFQITDLSGRLYRREKMISDKINIQDLSTGNYILQLETKEKTHTFKFLKK
jgi:surface protein